MALVRRLLDIRRCRKEVTMRVQRTYKNDGSVLGVDVDDTCYFTDKTKATVGIARKGKPAGRITVVSPDSVTVLRAVRKRS